MGDSPDNLDTPPWQDGEEAQEKARPSPAELEAAGQSALFGAPDPQEPEASKMEASPAEQTEAPQPAEGAPPLQAAPVKPSVPDAAQPYRVLARKYRPQTFSELIGQDAMVTTLAHAIERERLAHAFLMTGVRGVGKTSTARLIAKALNCVGPDGEGGPTIDPCGVCEPCVAISEGRHIDVIEMDAASHTGVDDVREIIEAVRYSAVSARYKIYIIDEVHMLSRNAFNALLKTLEEPPAHVKFLFATTEVDKLPVTVLSRTQRFDLRRIPTDMLHQHFASICRQEGVAAEEEALAMIAAAAEGSVRDGLSILDQAIAHADMDSGETHQTLVTAARVRDMLGLADKSAQRRLFAAILDGDPPTLLDAVDQQYALGVEPLALMRGTMELTHRIAVTQIGEGRAHAPTEEEKQAIEEWSGRLSAGQVHRLWQLLLKGYDEVRSAPDPLVAAQMALLRVLHAADMPDPGKLAKLIENMPAGAATGAPQTQSGEGGGATSGSTNAARDWPALCERVDQAGMLRVSQTMRDWVRVIELAPGRLVFTTPEDYAEDPTPDLRDALLKATGERWQVERGEGGGAPTLREREEAVKKAEAEHIRRDPLVEAAFAAFPDAEIVEDTAPAQGDRNWSKSA